MSDGHCFISYSRVDGLEFTTKLVNELEGGQQFIKVWFDKNDMTSSGGDWDEQIPSAIQNCKCFLFVITEDSAEIGSTTKEELNWALKYKKPIIPLGLHRTDDTLLFLLGNRPYINFSSNFDEALNKLRDQILQIESPKGQLYELQQRLADANRDLRRANDNDKSRIQFEIYELAAQIKRQEEIVKNPQLIELQTKRNLEVALERERVGLGIRTTSDQETARFINPPPGIAPHYFQNRYIETKQIVDFLKNDSQRLMTIVGRGGVGKTAIVCRLLKSLESGELPDGLDSMKVDGIVYLSEAGSHHINFANLFYDMCKLLPRDIALKLDTVYKNPQNSTESKMRALLEKFESKHVILLLDNFEPLVDIESFAILNTELDEALRTFLEGTDTAVKIVVTTRVAPRSLNLIQPGRQRVLTLDQGLDSPYAENILIEMDSDGRLGLKSANADILNRIRIKTRGFPRALEALFAILASDRYTSLEEMLSMPLPENVVEALVGEAFNRLDTNAQKVMQALAVYNRPVVPAAVDYLLAPYLPTIDSTPILQRLANMHFTRKESGRFYLHPVDREFAFGLIPYEEIGRKEEKSSKKLGLTYYKSRFSQHNLIIRAADFFSATRKPRAEWKKLDDLSALLAEFDLRCAAGNYEDAADLLTLFDFDYLLLWGHYYLLIGLYFRIKDKIRDQHLRVNNLNGLGLAHAYIGRVRESIDFYTQGLLVSREIKNRQAEGTFLGNLGNVYVSLQEFNNALECYNSALLIHREIGDRQGEGNDLGNLGSTYATLGKIHNAIKYFNQALAIAHEIGDKRNESATLSNLGNLEEESGKHEKALEFYQSALAISREIGDRRSEALLLGNLGLIYVSLGKIEEGKKFQEFSLTYAQEIGDRKSEVLLLSNLANTLAIEGNYVESKDHFEAALRISHQDVDKNSEYNILMGLGIIAVLMAEEEKALKIFSDAQDIAKLLGDDDKAIASSKEIEKIQKLEKSSKDTKKLELTVRDIKKFSKAQVISLASDIKEKRGSHE